MIEGNWLIRPWNTVSLCNELVIRLRYKPMCQPFSILNEHDYLAKLQVVNVCGSHFGLITGKKIWVHAHASKLEPNSVT